MAKTHLLSANKMETIRELFSSLMHFNCSHLSLSTGFLSVHDAIQSLRQIGDIKSHLDKEKLQKDIRHICCKVADSSD